MRRYLLAQLFQGLAAQHDGVDSTARASRSFAYLHEQGLVETVATRGTYVL
jgi:hypothetical protein